MGVVRHRDDWDPARPNAPKNGRVLVDVGASDVLRCSRSCGCWHLPNNVLAVICYKHELKSLARQFSGAVRT